MISDEHLADPDGFLAEIKGTAAYGARLGRWLPPGSKVDFGSDRALRFARAELAARRLTVVGGRVARDDPFSVAFAERAELADRIVAASRARFGT